MEIIDSQVMCEQCYFGSKIHDMQSRGGAEIVSHPDSNMIVSYVISGKTINVSPMTHKKLVQCMKIICTVRA